MADPLQTTLCGVTLQNPVIAASGTFGFGAEYAALFDVSRLGGVSGKGLTLHPSPGNKGVRLYETPSGMLNSIGLENPGVAHFVQHECAAMRALGPAVLCNLGGHSREEYVEGARLLNDADIDILELNISCPNLQAGGMAFGLYPENAADITREIRRVSRHPLLVKLTPAAPDIVSVALACEEAGANGLCLTNTFPGMAIDIRKKAPVFDNVYAGLSGPAIMPLALRLVHQVCRAVHIPVVGMGGIASYEDALCFLMAGATAVQIGSATFARPDTALRVIDGLWQYCKEERLETIQAIRGAVK